MAGAAWTHPCCGVCVFVRLFRVGHALLWGVVDVCDDLIVECSSWTQFCVFRCVFAMAAHGSLLGLVVGLL